MFPEYLCTEASRNIEILTAFFSTDRIFPGFFLSWVIQIYWAYMRVILKLRGVKVVRPFCLETYWQKIIWKSTWKFQNL